MSDLLERPSLQTIHDDADLRIVRHRGRGGHTVISFAGVGLGHIGGAGEQREEFGRTLTEALADANVIFVVDRRRSWMNGTGPRIVAALRELTAHDESVVTLGNSMGGFSALWAAGHLPRCIRAVAIAPQFSVHPDHMPVEEDRWRPHRTAIRHHTVTHALERMSPAVEYWAVVGDGHVGDVRHADLLAQHGGDALRLLRVANSDHDVARDLRRAGALTPLLRLLLGAASSTADQASRVLDRAGLALA